MTLATHTHEELYSYGMGWVQPSAVWTHNRPACSKASGRAGGCSEILAWINRASSTSPVRQARSFPANNSAA